MDYRLVQSVRAFNLALNDSGLADPVHSSGGIHDRRLQERGKTVIIFTPDEFFILFIFLPLLDHPLEQLEVIDSGKNVDDRRARFEGKLRVDAITLNVGRTVSEKVIFIREKELEDVGLIQTRRIMDSRPALGHLVLAGSVIVGTFIFLKIALDELQIALDGRVEPARFPPACAEGHRCGCDIKTIIDELSYYPISALLRRFLAGAVLDRFRRRHKPQRRFRLSLKDDDTVNEVY